MPRETGRQGAVRLEEVVMAQALELEALMDVLEKKGVLRKAEVLEEMKLKRLRETAPKEK
jgi:hypothetical protein